ncbi:ferritin-like domain-containing protein [Inquilinus sp. OTU3971]|uniref:ferritin-like domain-containing protein n=1 Tax=Inquilinus sp. OTU3971 TaxID=3043855 RepID=UPI00313CFF72
MDALTDLAVAVLETADPLSKIELSHQAAAAWRQRAIPVLGTRPPSLRPARPAVPELRRPGDMPKRRLGGEAGRIALLHALAHIELNAIDLSWDLIARFATAETPESFFDDWVKVADEEATHHGLLSVRLNQLGSAYGALPAHDGLWQAAEETAEDLLGRLSVVPLVLEARGLDVTPETVERLERAGDADSARILHRIYTDEIGHVAAGRRWFEWECGRQGRAPIPTYHELVRRYFRARLKRPFNVPARDLAGFAAAFYEPLAE